METMRSTASAVRPWPVRSTVTSSVITSTASVHRGRRAGEGDLVAADVDPGLELALQDAQELVAGAEDVHHVDRGRHASPGAAPPGLIVGHC